MQAKNARESMKKNMATCFGWKKKYYAKLCSICVDTNHFQALLFLIGSSLLVTIFTATLLTPSSLVWLWRQLPTSEVVFRSHVNDSLYEYSDVDQLPPAQEGQIDLLLTSSDDALFNKLFVNPMISHNNKPRIYHRGQWRRSEWRLPTRQGSLQHPQGFQLEFYNNKKWSPFYPKMRMLLKNWVANRKFQPSIMHELLTNIKDPIDENYMRMVGLNNHHYNIKRGQKYKTCAVVGNSGVLLQRNYSKLIDDHDMVMRINNARTSGFEKFVGRKTTISFMNSHILRICSWQVQCFCHPYGKHIPIVTYLCEPWHFMPIAYCSSAHPSAPLIVTHPQFDNLCNRIAKWYAITSFLNHTPYAPASSWTPLRNHKRVFHYSSGMQAVVMALGICESVDLFGFGKSASSKHHYHTSQIEELRDVHDYTAEYQFYHDLQERKFADMPFFLAVGFQPAAVRVFA